LDERIGDTFVPVNSRAVFRLQAGSGVCIAPVEGRHRGIVQHDLQNHAGQTISYCVGSYGFQIGIKKLRYP
jgi:hypothetical protein